MLWSKYEGKRQSFSIFCKDRATSRFCLVFFPNRGEYNRKKTGEKNVTETHQEKIFTDRNFGKEEQ